jgi:hypothetical protein
MQAPVADLAQFKALFEEALKDDSMSDLKGADSPICVATITPVPLKSAHEYWLAGWRPIGMSYELMCGAYNTMLKLRTASRDGARAVSVDGGSVGTKSEMFLFRVQDVDGTRTFKKTESPATPSMASSVATINDNLIRYATTSLYHFSCAWAHLTPWWEKKACTLP